MGLIKSNNMLLKAKFKELEALKFNSTADLQTRLVNSYAKALEDVRKTISSVYEKLGNNPSITELRKYNRLAEVEKSLVDNIKGLNSTLKLSISTDLTAITQIGHDGVGSIGTMIKGMDAVFAPIIESKGLLKYVGDDLWKDALNNNNAKLISDVKREFETVLRANAKEEVISGIAQGKSYKDVMTAIKGRFDVTATRSKTIAFTEMHKAHSYGREVALSEASTAAAAIGIKVNKIWRHSSVGKPRMDHVAADGQIANEEGLFNVGGELLLGPGLGSDPSNNINCHCTAEMELAESAANEAKVVKQSEHEAEQKVKQSTSKSKQSTTKQPKTKQPTKVESKPITTQPKTIEPKPTIPKIAEPKPTTKVIEPTTTPSAAGGQGLLNNPSADLAKRLKDIDGTIDKSIEDFMQHNKSVIDAIKPTFQKAVEKAQKMAAKGGNLYNADVTHIMYDMTKKEIMFNNNYWRAKMGTVRKPYNDLVVKTLNTYKKGLGDLYQTHMTKWYDSSNGSAGGFLKYSAGKANGTTTYFQHLPGMAEDASFIGTDVGLQQQLKTWVTETLAKGYTDEDLSAIVHIVQRYNKAMVKEVMGTDTVTLYRGVRSSYFKANGIAVGDIKKGANMILRENPVASWSLSPAVAKDFDDGAIFQTTIKMDEVMSSILSGPTSYYFHETEMLVAPKNGTLKVVVNYISH